MIRSRLPAGQRHRFADMATIGRAKRIEGREEAVIARHFRVAHARLETAGGKGVDRARIMGIGALQPGGRDMFRRRTGRFDDMIRDGRDTQAVRGCPAKIILREIGAASMIVQVAALGHGLKEDAQARTAMHDPIQIGCRARLVGQGGGWGSRHDRPGANHQRHQQCSHPRHSNPLFRGLSGDEAQDVQ